MATYLVHRFTFIGTEICSRIRSDVLQFTTSEYELTKYGRNLESVIIHLAQFGNDHRKEIISGR